MWQLVLIAWGTKYGPDDINALVAAVRAQSRGPARVVLITDRDRPGLAAGIETRPHPPEFLQPPMTGGGCQAKLAMFKPGLLPADMPAIFLDLDTVVLGDVSRLLSACPAPENVAILQSAVLPFGAVARWIWRLTGGRKYARGNSSVVVFHPAHAGYIAERFLDCLARHPDFGFRPMAADERFISWCAQPVMRAVPTSLAVKFPTEFMYPRLWLGRLRGALPWVRRRRAGLVAITLPGVEVKAAELLALPEGAIVTDRKGRRMEWSDRYLGPIRQRLVALLSRNPPPGP
ncbi:hypothetical protein G5B31_15125 [Rhodobacter sp. SGA-6-6]|uniref:hypothetical protein n=1 Tax=Rhodobacter sp. SGA-6-6 TaxID=2710882 RepID=UPI0013EDDCBE|nr:hypothetical protein [Rhodobacter sp. SGA-6-6]NGM46867.1 hypothetical protein [Rhodobacter sp. SGA-6-6]